MYNHIVVGGTFDGLHSGHTHFLTNAIQSARKATIGLTSEAYIRRFKRDSGVSPFSLRYRALTQWLRKNGFAQKVRIVSLDNKWGPVLLPDTFDAIAVTSENSDTAAEINIVRAQRGLSPLALVPIELLAAEDQKPISSSRIRSGEIDTKGSLRLPDHLRPALQQPLGRILPAFECKEAILRHKDDICITVGDVTTETVFYCGIQPSLAIIDLHVERKPYPSSDIQKFPKKYSKICVKSGPGYIAKTAIAAILQWKKGAKLRKRVVILVDGEEDLLVLPAISFAPLGSWVYYGSPPISGNEGLVEVLVTRELKQKVTVLLSQFLQK